MDKRPFHRFRVLKLDGPCSLQALGYSSYDLLSFQRQIVSSTDKDVQKNPDGSVDVYFGPKAPAGKEANWVYTSEGKNWFPWFRFYGPEKAVEDKSWKMPDIEKVN